MGYCIGFFSEGIFCGNLIIVKNGKNCLFLRLLGGIYSSDDRWFYDMTADGFSLDDKRSPITDNDIPDIIERFRHPDKERDRKQNMCLT